MREALKQAGFAGRPRAVVDPARYRGYLEAHIEQGAELEDSGRRIGIVTAIVGSHRFRIVFEGVQNHAGTTRMAIRKDAGVALVQLASAIYRRFPDVAGARTVWTTGRITLDPGAPSIVPGRAEMLFQFRDTDPALLAALERELETLVAEATRGPCTVTIAERGRSVAEGDGRRLPGCIGARRRTSCAGTACAHAERRRARRADPGGADAVGDAVRAFDRRHQPPLRGKHQGRRHRARLPGVRRRGGGDFDGRCAIAPIRHGRPPAFAGTCFADHDCWELWHSD